MNKAVIAKIEKLYATMQQQFCVKQGSLELAQATQFYTNRSRPVHRWFHFKEGFSANIFTAAGIDIKPLSQEGSVFLDPFCGSGTTLLAGDLEYGWRARRIGIEINPFMAFVANTKVNWRLYNPIRFIRIIDKLLSEPLKRNVNPTKWPILSTFHNPDIFQPSKVSALLDLINRVQNIEEPERDLLMLGIAASAERLGFYRKDGRALRILRSDREIKSRKSLDVKSVIKGTWNTFIDDLNLLHKQKQKLIGECRVLQGDGRMIEIPNELGIEPGEVTLITYSPPYFNHIDYTEVYKVELWLLGFITHQEEMLNLRKKTLRSHASIYFSANGTNLPLSVKKAVGLAASEIEVAESNWHKRFRDTAFGYFEDLHQTLARQYELLCPGGYLTTKEMM